MTEKNLVFN